MGVAVESMVEAEAETLEVVVETAGKGLAAGVVATEHRPVVDLEKTEWDCHERNLKWGLPVRSTRV